MFYVNGLEVLVHKFPSGEFSVVIPENSSQYPVPVVEVRDTSINMAKADTVVILCLIANAIKRMAITPYSIELVLPYFPGARGDRVMQYGGSLDVEAYADILKSAGYKRFVINTPHSAVTSAVLGNVVEISTIEARIDMYLKYSILNPVLVSPDAGSDKRTEQYAKALEINTVIRCSKVRNGRDSISTFVPDFKHRDDNVYIVVDDICDAGGTFIGIAKAIRAKEPTAKLVLCVEHGLFTKGTEVILEHYDKII
jgi:ribose-phosphate pyrophosphokinase